MLGGQGTKKFSNHLIAVVGLPLGASVGASPIDVKGHDLPATVLVAALIPRAIPFDDTFIVSVLCAHPRNQLEDWILAGIFFPGLEPKLDHAEEHGLVILNCSDATWALESLQAQAVRDVPKKTSGSNCWPISTAQTEMARVNDTGVFDAD